MKILIMLILLMTMTACTEPVKDAVTGAVKAVKSLAWKAAKKKIQSEFPGALDAIELLAKTDTMFVSAHPKEVDGKIVICICVIDRATNKIIKEIIVK